VPRCTAPAYPSFNSTGPFSHGYIERHLRASVHWFASNASHRSDVSLVLRLNHTRHAVLMPFPYRAPAMPSRVNSHTPCRAPAILRQCRVLRESPRGSRKYPNCQSYSLTDWYASDNNLRGTPRGSRKKLNAGRSPTYRLWTADANSHAPYHAHAALCDGLEKSLSERHGHCMVRVNQSQPHCVNQMGKTQSTPLAARHGHGMGTAWARHGHGMGTTWCM
jgi:hypothetical protein